MYHATELTAICIHCAMLAAVVDLSDDEVGGVAQSSQPTEPGQRPNKRKQGASLQLLAKDPGLVEGHLRRIVSGRCPGKLKARRAGMPNCFSRFRESDVFTRLCQLRKSLLSMNKEDSDKRVSLLVPFKLSYHDKVWITRQLV